jgi:hypothetical protein
MHVSMADSKMLDFRKIAVNARGVTKLRSKTEEMDLAVPYLVDFEQMPPRASLKVTVN